METVEDVKGEIQRTLVPGDDAPIRFVLTQHGMSHIVATIGFHSISTQMRTAEVAFDVAPSHWGKGIATAACLAATQWGFDARGWSRVQGTAIVPNVASQRVMMKCGFAYEGLLRSFRPVRGVPTDYRLYSVLPGELLHAA